MPTNKYFACPFCKERFTREDMIVHIDRKHYDELPEGFTPLRATFHAVNRKDFKYNRPCRICKKPTPWNEDKGRYDFLCGNPACKTAWINTMKDTMGEKYGAFRPTTTAEGLEKMLAARKISGTYKFSTGGTVPYTGSYEKKCLEFMDKVLNVKIEDIEMPGPAIKYPYKGKDHIYIPDIYYKPYNLLIEVKDGGSNPNNHPGYSEVRAKKIAKENYVIKHTDYNYLRLTDNDFSQLLGVFADLKLHLNNDDKSRVIHVHESGLYEHMGIAAMNPIVGFIPGKDAVIVNNPSRQTFGVVDSPKFEKVITLDAKNHLGLQDKQDFGNEDEIKTYIKKDKYKDIASELKKFMDNDQELSESAFYELLFGHPMYTKDQILFEDVIDYDKYMASINNIVIESTITSLFGDTDDPNYISEGFDEFKSTFLNEEDVKYNYDAFSTGNSDVLFISGPETFGRAADFSTIAQQFGADIIHLDDVQKHYLYSDKKLKEKHELIYKYFCDSVEGVEERKKKKKDPEVNLYETVPHFLSFFLECKYPNKRYIVEGHQLLDLLAANRINFEMFKPYSVLLKGSSYLQTQIQTMKSDSNTDTEEDAFKLMKDYIDAISDRVKNLTHDNFSKSLKKKEDIADKDVSDVIKDAMNENADFSPKDLLNEMKSIKYKDFTKLMSWEEVEDSQSGSCHDQVMYELHELKKLCLEPKALFLIELKEGQEQGGRTHSLVYYNEGGKLYWFENAWESQVGIHGPYDSLEDIKKDVEEKMLKESNYDHVEFGAFKGLPGMSLQELVDACMDGPIDEATIFNDKDLYYNKAKFDSGEINICFITGHSGGGKSTMAKDMGSNVEHCELDDVAWNKESYTMNQLKNMGELIYSFFSGPGKKYYYTQADVKDGKVKAIDDYEEALMNDFVRYAISYANSHKDKKFVVEGVWLVDFIKPEVLKDCAVYIKGTSLLVSRWRAAKRDSQDAPEGQKTKAQFKNFFNKDLWNSNKDFGNDLKKFRSYFENSMKNESDIIKESNDDSYPIISKPYFITAKDNSINACITINGYDKPFRARSSMLILKFEDGDWKVFLSKDNERGHEYHAPGGGWNKGETPENAAIREAQEECYMNVDNVKRMGFLIETHDKVADWVKENVSDSKDWWYNYYSEIFVGTYESKFDGEVKDEDKDQIANSGKWYSFEEIKDTLTPKEYISAIEDYISNIHSVANEFSDNVGNWSNDFEDDVFYCIEDDTIDLTGDLPLFEVSEEDLKKNIGLSPVFVMLSFNGGVVGKVIKGYGKDLGWEYSHSSISLLPSLSTLYSFNIVKTTDEEGKKHKYNGLAIEHFRDFRNNPQCKIKVIAILVDSDTKAKIKKAIQYYIDNIDKTKYATMSLGKALLGTGGKVQNYGNMTLFCSQFVDSILKQANIDIAGKGSSINVHPSELGQFKDRNNYFTVYEGKASGYDEAKVEQKINYMKATMSYDELSAITDRTYKSELKTTGVENRLKSYVGRKIANVKNKKNNKPEPLNRPLAVEGGT